MDTPFFGIGRVTQVNAKTGIQRIVSEGQNLVGPVGITLNENGQLIVGDPYTINLDSANWFDGGIICIDPITGFQDLIARGHGSFINPRGVAVVPVGQHNSTN